MSESIDNFGKGRGTLLLGVLTLTTLFGCAEPEELSQLKSDVRFDVHAVKFEAAENTFSVRDSNSEEELHLVRPPIVSAGDVAGVALEQTPQEGHVLRVKVSEAAGKRLYDATAETGERIAIMVNGRFIAAPVIKAQIRSDFKLTVDPEKEPDWASLIE